jgi:glycosyltransferase involved in cell wall biosynthesis
MKKLLRSVVPQAWQIRFQTYKQYRSIDFSGDEPLPPAIYDVKESPLRISLCTTCMNRAHHVKYTLIKNLLDNCSYPDFECVLLNYNSEDDLDFWCRKNLRKEIESGKVIYASTLAPLRFNSSHAKNIAHALATGDVLVNVDADNFVGKDFCFYLNHLFQNTDSPLVVQFVRSLSCAGRIALKKTHFLEIRGYNEALTAERFGYEDYDILERLSASGFSRKEVGLGNFTRHFWHDDAVRTINFAASEEAPDEASHKNYLMSKKNIEKGLLFGNSGPWAEARLSADFGSTYYDLSL